MLRSIELPAGSVRAMSPALRLPRPLRAPDSRRTGPGVALPGRVLIVEDDYFVALESEAALLEAGHEVVAAVTTGEEALEVAERARPELAVMDIRLAGTLDGIDTAAELLRRHGLRSIFASAHADPGTRARAEAARPLGWLTKPYTGRALVAAVASAFATLRGPGGRG
jgi:CheY-like chemotaxis protein